MAATDVGGEELLAADGIDRQRKIVVAGKVGKDHEIPFARHTEACFLGLREGDAVDGVDAKDVEQATIDVDLAPAVGVVGPDVGVGGAAAGVGEDVDI